MTPPPPRFPDDASRETIQRALVRAGYREAELRDRLRGIDLGRPRPTEKGRMVSHVEALEGPLGTLLRAFHLERELPLDQVRNELGRDVVEALVASWMATVEEGVFRPAVILSALGERLVAGDLRARHRAGAGDYVSSPLAVTRNLAAFALWPSGGSVLDLGCGGGALALLAAERADRVVATDVSPRAVAFARFNVALNGVEGVEVREGSLFDPVSDERFDLVICNPPFVLSPDAAFTYRDGGPALSRRIVRDAPERLTEGGVLQMTVEWPERDDRAWSAEPASWVEGRPWDVWLLRLYTYRADDYVRHWLRQDYAGGTVPADAARAWREHLEEEGAASVGGGILTLRPSRASRPIRAFRDTPPWSPEGAAESLRAWIEAGTLRASVDETAMLLDTLLVPAPGLESVRRRIVGDGGWETRDRTLRLGRGVRFGASVDPVTEEIVGLLDGERTPREALGVLAERHGLEVERFVEGLPSAVDRLLERGLLVPG